ncbi:MAG TPA: SDR family NAD(P)-dependent oxidoreductase [Mycobacteriales bacterium]|nr:SDR family NAD(P)-dependent oxidoreductase [Mycobacteriales bacterium]HWA67694.1 SDR family NAD(P)-dependent oxidoreductase [Mycobacteriales bacterium]
MSVDLTGRIAWITGGSQGFGAAVARRLTGHGATVVLSDIKEAAGQALAEELGGSFVACDVTSFEQCQAAVRAVLDKHGRLDIAFLNAGVTTGCGLGEDFDPALYRRAMGVNIDGVVYGAHAAYAALKADGGGDLIATASLAGLTGTAFDPVYGANKHAVVGLVRALGDDWPNQGIRVNALCPGFADTEIVNEIRGVLADSGIPLIEVERVVDAFMAALTSGRSAECWYIQPGRQPEPFRFRGIPGPRVAE